MEKYIHLGIVYFFIILIKDTQCQLGVSHSENIEEPVSAKFEFGKAVKVSAGRQHTVVSTSQST